MCINKGLSRNVDISKDTKSRPTSNMIPNMLVFVIVMDMLNNYIQNNVKRSFIQFRMWTCMLWSHEVYQGVWFYHRLSVKWG